MRHGLWIGVFSLLGVTVLGAPADFTGDGRRPFSAGAIFRQKLGNALELVNGASIDPRLAPELVVCTRTDGEIHLPASGSPGVHRVRFACIAGGEFSAPVVYLNGREVFRPAAGNPEAKPAPIMFTFKTPPMEGDDRIRLEAPRGKRLGLLYFNFRPAREALAPLPPDRWRVTVSADAEKLLSEADNGYPAALGWQDFERAKPENGTRYYATHYTMRTTWKNHWGHLTARGPAEVWTGGHRIASIPAGKTECFVEFPWYRVRPRAARLVVKTADPNFKLAVEAQSGGEFFREIPEHLKVFAPNADWPRVKLDNGLIQAVVALPDDRNGFYRSIRFERAGILESLRFKDHEYVYRNYQPATRDPNWYDGVGGPAEEFATPIGFDEAKPGEPFLKPGVGTLEKPWENFYFFGSNYKPVAFFPWEVKQGDNAVTFTQKGGVNNFGYEYVKTLRLTPGKPELTIEYRLTNTGKKRFSTTQYAHNFWSVADAPVGPDYRIELGFNPTQLTAQPGKFKQQGRTISPQKPPCNFTMQGCNSGKHNVFTVKHVPSGRSLTVRDSGTPRHVMFYMSNRVICPESFDRIDLGPGESYEWTRRYEFQ